MSILLFEVVNIHLHKLQYRHFVTQEGLLDRNSLVRSGSLNAVRARRQVTRLCEQYGLNLVL